MVEEMSAVKPSFVLHLCFQRRETQGPSAAATPCPCYNGYMRIRRISCLLPLIALLCVVTAGERLVEAPFVIEFDPGRDALARRSLAVLQEARAEVAKRLPCGDAPVRVVICSTMASFERSTRLRSRGHLVEGVARSEQGVIVVKAPGLRRQAFDYAGTLRHELIHVLLARNTDVSALPRWLNEGLAMTVGGDYRWESMFRVARMHLGGRIIPYRELNLELAAPHTDLAFGDAYAQSLSMTRFLRDRIGEEGLWQLVGALRTTTFSRALEDKTGLTPWQLHEAWEHSLWKVAVVSSLVSGCSLFPLGALLLTMAYWRKRRRGQRILARWEEEEAEADDGCLLAHELEGREPPHAWEADYEEE